MIISPNGATLIQNFWVTKKHGSTSRRINQKLIVLLDESDFTQLLNSTKSLSSPYHQNLIRFKCPTTIKLNTKSWEELISLYIRMLQGDKLYTWG